MAYTKQTWVNDVSALSAGRMGHIEDGIEAAHSSLVPTGAIMASAAAGTPTGWLLCDGQSYLRADYNDLFTALGGASSPWGLPDGTHFNVPDLRGRLPVGIGSHTDVDALAETDGTALSSRTPKHNHTVSSDHTHDISHTHSIGLYGGGATAATVAGGNSSPAASGATGGASPSTSAGASAATTVGPQTNAPTDGPAYVVVNYIIKT